MSKSHINDTEARAFRRKYLENTSPTGHEVKGQKIWVNQALKYMSAKDEIISDSYGGVAAVIKGTNSNYKVVLDAHADEISWRILHIEDNGMIGVMRNGGSDARVAVGNFVEIHSSKGKVDGVFGSPAIHVRHDDHEKKEPKDEDLRVDVFAQNKQEVLDMGIDVGMTLTYASTFKELNKGKAISGRALDDRIGGCITIEIIRQLKEQNIVLPYDLYIVNAIQEETGLRGASMMANIIQPDLAVAIDVGHDTTTKGYNKSKQGDIACGKGPIIAYGATLHPKVIDQLVKTAKQNKISIQKTSTPYSSGADSDAYAYQNKGCPTALVSLPLRYMHTPVETIAVQDMVNTADLLLAFLKNVDGNKSQFDPHDGNVKKWNHQLQNKG